MMNSTSKSVQQISELQDSYKKSRDKFANKPQSWFIAATRLRVAAKILEQAISEQKNSDARLALGYYIGPVYLMLTGFVIENMLKGIIVHRIGSFPKRSLTHDLLALWKQADLPEDDLPFNKDKILEKLTEFTIWVGRYYVAKDAKSMGSFLTKSFNPKLDIPKCEKLIRFLKREALKLNPKYSLE